MEVLLFIVTYRLFICSVNIDMIEFKSTVLLPIFFLPHQAFVSPFLLSYHILGITMDSQCLIMPLFYF